MMVWIFFATATAHGASPGLYLDQERVLETLAQAPIQSCAAAVEGLEELVLRWQVEASGQVANARIAEPMPGREGLEACVLQAVRGLRFAEHHESTLSLSHPLVFRAGSWVPHPLLEGLHRPVGPLLLALPPDLDPAARERIQLQIWGSGAEAQGG